MPRSLPMLPPANDQRAPAAPRRRRRQRVPLLSCVGAAAILGSLVLGIVVAQSLRIRIQVLAAEPAPMPNVIRLFRVNQ